MVRTNDWLGAVIRVALCIGTQNALKVLIRLHFDDVIAWILQIELGLLLFRSFMKKVRLGEKIDGR